ncbi:DNA repair protein RadC [Chitinimonas sp.]|uniref:RadC family protein n=1 Tax=Chitinimonas sp. TaxID=1934313 RepID=UPI0035B286B8
MSIADWPSDDRPREKLLLKGAAMLSDAELLAIFLRTGLPGKSAVDLARQLLQRFGSLNQLFHASLADFTSIAGMGSAKYAQLQAVVEMARRALAENLTQLPVFSDPQSVRNYLRLWLGSEARETFGALFLDSQHRLISAECLFFGTIDQATVHPRELVKRGIAVNAAAVVVAHNHPSGHAEPSVADIALTKRLQDALLLVDIRLLDHFVVTTADAVSMAERGLLHSHG